MSRIFHRCFRAVEITPRKAAKHRRLFSSGSRRYFYAHFHLGYVLLSKNFLAFDVARGFWCTVNSTYSIARLVSFGKKPMPVPLDLVSQLMLRLRR